MSDKQLRSGYSSENRWYRGRCQLTVLLNLNPITSKKIRHIRQRREDEELNGELGNDLNDGSVDGG